MKEYGSSFLDLVMKTRHSSWIAVAAIARNESQYLTLEFRIVYHSVTYLHSFLHDCMLSIVMFMFYFIFVCMKAIHFGGQIK